MYKELIVILPLAFLIPFFVDLISNRLLEDDKEDDKEHDQSKKEYNKYVFKTVCGLLLVAYGMYTRNEIQSFGFGTGGAFVLVFANLFYWQNLDENWKTVIIGASIASLVGIGGKLIR